MLKHIKNLFIPHEGNGYKPDFLQRISVTVMFGLILLSFALANLQSVLWITSDWMISAVLPGVLVELTNEKRGENALNMLTMDPVLTEAANMKAQHMADNEYFAHYSPDGVSPWHWFDETSYNFVHAGENLAVHFTESDEVVTAWMNSPAHRANILNGDYTEIGIGTARGEYKGYPTVFVVQLFGTPALARTDEGAVSEVLAAENDDSRSDAITLETVTENEDTSGGNDSVAPATFETATTEEEGTSSTEASAASSTVVIASSTPSTTSEQGTSTLTEDIPEERKEIVSIYSDLATTSRDGVPAVTGWTDPGSVNGSTPYTRIFAKSALIPSFWLQMFYGGVAAVVVFALILSILIEWRRQHPMQILYGTGLLAMMALLFHAHALLSSGVTIV